MVWNAVVRVTVAKLLRDGLSAGQIAEKLPFAISRNAVIGLVHRDETLRAIGFKNAPRRPQGQKQPEPMPVPMPKKTERREEPAAAKGATSQQPSIHGPAGETIRSAQGAVKETTPLTGQPPTGVVSTPIGVPLVEIRDGLCRFPLWGNDGAPDFLMCGKAAPAGQVYCERHRVRTTSAARAA
jgi:GcrA cell cycle regulator